MNHQLLRQVAAHGKYAPLFRHLAALETHRWPATFREVEAVLGFSLPNSARVHRPWWSNQANGGHSHALAWRAAGWKTCAVDLAQESLVFERIKDTAPASDSAAPALSMRELFPPHDFGTWPEGFAASREQIYGDQKR